MEIANGMITVKTTVSRDYRNESKTVKVRGEETKEVTLEREVESLEDMVWALEADTHEVVRDLWSEVKDQDEFERYGFTGYASGDITVEARKFAGYSWHDVVDYICERDNISDNERAGVYMDLRSWNQRTPKAGSLDPILKALIEYLGKVEGIDTKTEFSHGYEGNNPNPQAYPF